MKEMLGILFEIFIKFVMIMSYQEELFWPVESINARR